MNTDPPDTLSDLAPPDAQATALGVVNLVAGLAMLGMAATFPCVGPLGATNDPDFASLPAPWAIGLVMGVVAGAFVAVFAVVYLAGGIGLLRGRRWGWILGLLLCAGWATSCCAPLGAWGLWVLLRAEGRRRFGIG